MALVPSSENIDAEAEQRMEARQSRVVVLETMLEMTPEGTFSLTASPELRGLRRIPPQTDQTAFPTPTGATWEQLRLRMVDGHTVSARVGNVSDRLHYSQLGLANRRNGKPSVLWDLLRIFAEAHGRLDWSNRQADRRLQKRRELLSKSLQRYFGIEGDPINRSGNGWECRFSISQN